MSENLLVMFSGGIGSTGALLQTLNNPQYQKHNILLHHVYIQLYGHDPKSAYAKVEKIIPLIKKISGRQLFLSSSIMGFEDLNPAAELPNIQEIVHFIAGNLIHVDLTIKQLVWGFNADTPAKPWLDKGREIFEILRISQPKESPAVVSAPLSALSTQEIYNSLPDELKEVYAESLA